MHTDFETNALPSEGVKQKESSFSSVIADSVENFAESLT